MADARRRVKLYALNADRQWDDRGTGHVSSTYIDRLKGMSLVVRAESDGSVLLESKIQPDTAYQKQQETLIVWSEAENFDLALSFQEKAGCDEIWEKICQVQGRDPTLDVTQDIVEESEDERFEDVPDTALPIELPPCEVNKLEEVSELITSCLPSPIRREKLSLLIESENYIKKLLDVFHMCEDFEIYEKLHQLYEIFKNMFKLNKNALFEILFAEENIFDVIGVLEYDPTSPVKKRHREYLKNCSKFKEVIPITNPELVAKIQQTYRVQYIQDVVLPTPTVFEENMLSALSSFIFFNKVEIVSLLQDDQKYLAELFAQLIDESTDDDKRKDLVMFLKEFCMFSQTLQPQSRESFFKLLSSLGVLQALEITLEIDDTSIKAASIDILSYIVDFSPSMVRDYALQQVNSQNSDQLIINIIIEQMLCDPDPELGSAVQLSGVIRSLLDPGNMLAAVNKSDFLNYFYKNCMQLVVSPLLANTTDDKPIKEDGQTAQLLGLILELLSFCVEHHTYHIKNYILNRDLLRRILVLMKSKHTFLVLCALRFMRKIIGLRDEFYNRYIINGNLFTPVVDAFKRNNGRYNLLDSAILEMFEFIKLEDIKTLYSHVVERHGKILNKVDYIQTFRALKLRYEQHKDRMKDCAGGVENVSQIMKSNRFRRDARQMDVDEEIWFEEDDDEDKSSSEESSATDEGLGSGESVKKIDEDDEIEQQYSKILSNKRTHESEEKENVKAVPNRSLSPVTTMNSRKSSGGGGTSPNNNNTSQLSSSATAAAVEVRSSQLTRRGGLVDYPDEDSEEDVDEEEDSNTDSVPPSKCPRLGS